jgi:hypothetical protein
MMALLYPWLADVASRWNEAMRIDERHPSDHAAYLKHCHAAGQTRPTPLLLIFSAYLNMSNALIYRSSA